MSLEQADIQSVPELFGSEQFFVKTPEIEQLANDLAEASIDWVRVGRKFTQTDFYQFGEESAKFQGTYMELAINGALRRIVSEYPNDIKNNFIQDGDTTENYIFTRRNEPSEILVQSVHTREAVCAYDNLLQINTEEGEVPVIIEVKSQGNIRSGSPGKGIVGLDIDKRLRKIVHPVQEYYGTSEVGMILVTLGDVFSEESSYPKRLSERGICLAPIDATYSEFMVHLINATH